MTTEQAIEHYNNRIDRAIKLLRLRATKHETLNKMLSGITDAELVTLLSSLAEINQIYSEGRDFVEKLNNQNKHS